jgi:hypothetical protein
MTQDQPGQAQGTGYVARGEVVPDDETGTLESEQSGPMTRLRKVASAMRGDGPDQTVPEQTVPDQTAATSPDTPDPNGSWPPRPGEPGAMSDPAPEDEMADGEYADATRPNDVGAVRNPEDGDRDYWDDQRATTAPNEGTTAPVGTTGAGGAGGTAPTPGYGNQADTATGYGSQADTATAPQGLTGTGPAATEAGTAKGGAAGRHAAAAADAGLRPGEATDRIGDFGDIAFGNLLPDAGQYTTRWQQIQFRFVDDPQGSVTEAADVISQVTTKLEAAIQERQRAIEERQRAIQERASALRGRWGEGSNADTETLRETLRMYRAFMDQLIGPAAQRAS